MSILYRCKQTNPISKIPGNLLLFSVLSPFRLEKNFSFFTSKRRHVFWVTHTGPRSRRNNHFLCNFARSIITVMKRYFLSKCLAAILLMAGTLSLSSCLTGDLDKAEPITAYNKLTGVYSISGKVYNYSGSVTWTGPPAPVPVGYTSTVNLPPLSPKTATVFNGTTVWLDFADFVSPDYKYIFTTSSNFASISYDLSTVPSTNFSNISKYVVSYIAPTATTKASFRVMTHYNDNPTGTGNSHIVDETFVQQ